MTLTKLHCIVTASTFPSLLVNPSQCSKYLEHLSHCSVMDGSLVHIVSFWDFQELIYKWSPITLWGCYEANVKSHTEIQLEPNLSTQFSQGLNKNSCLDCHVQTTCNSGSLQGLLGTISLPHFHQTRHFILSKDNFFTTPVSKGDVSCWQSRHKLLCAFS